MQVGNKVVVYEINESNENSEKILKKVVEWDFSKVKPWMITVGQMDEDDSLEVFIACYYETLFYKKADTRPYFFEYNDGELIKQWTGSYLNSLAFDHADFVDRDSDGFDELRVYERVIEKGRYIDRVSYYGIRGFYPYLME